MKAGTGASLMREARARAALSQRQLAQRAGTAPSVVARIELGDTSPTFQTLERLVGAAGFDLAVELVPRTRADPVIDAYKHDIDRSLLRENLRRSPDERLKSLAALARLAQEARRGGRTARRGR
jgi:transcriptional regulator with XRE-family HTH domain